MGNWYAEVEYVAVITQPQLEQFAEGAANAYYNSKSLILRLGHWLDAEDYDAALAEGSGWAAGLPATELVKGADGWGPIRFMVESDAARASSWAVGTKEAAEMLGVTPTRLRQLEIQARDFPAPAAELAGGSVWHRDEVEKFAAERTRGRGGRPRKEP